MKKLLLLLALAFTGTVNAATPISPKENGPFESGRLVVQSTTTPYVDFIVTDLKTGCQYMGTNGYGIRYIPLGCSPEYISDKFKK